MKTDLCRVLSNVARNRLFTNLYEENKGKTPYTIHADPTDYNEPFDLFIESLIATDLLDKELKEILRGLLSQWRQNKLRRE